MSNEAFDQQQQGPDGLRAFYRARQFEMGEFDAGNNAQTKGDYYREASQFTIHRFTLGSRPSSVPVPTTRRYQDWQRGPPHDQVANTHVMHGGNWAERPSQFFDRPLHEEPDQGMGEADCRSAAQDSFHCNDLRPEMFLRHAKSDPTPVLVPATGSQTQGLGRSVGAPAPLQVATHNLPPSYDDSLTMHGSAPAPPPQSDRDRKQVHETVEQFHSPASDVPQLLRNHANTFHPNLHAQLGVAKPFAQISPDDIWSIWTIAVPDIAVSDDTEWHIVELAVEATHQWQQRFVSRALQFLDATWLELENGNTKEGRRRWVEEMSPPGEKYPPFYFGEYCTEVTEHKDGYPTVIKAGERKRIYQSRFVASTLSAHLEVVPEDSRFEPFPCGAFAFALGACGFALDIWRNGAKATPTRNEPNKLAIETAFAMAVSVAEKPQLRQEVIEAAIERIPYYQSASGSSSAKQFASGFRYN